MTVQLSDFRDIKSVSIPVDFAFTLEGMWGVCLQFNEQFWNFYWRIKWCSIFRKFRRWENVVGGTSTEVRPSFC